MSTSNYYRWRDLERAVDSIVSQLAQDEWCPEYIVGIGRSGLPMAVMLSYRLNRPMVSLDISLHRSGEPVSNLWLAEWAFGYIESDMTSAGESHKDENSQKKILIVDNFNNTGATFQWIVDDWQKSCFANQKNAWDQVWNNSTRFAVMINNTNSDFEVDYYWKEINKADDTRIIFPWENR